MVFHEARHFVLRLYVGGVDEEFARGRCGALLTPHDDFFAPVAEKVCLETWRGLGCIAGLG